MKTAIYCRVAIADDESIAMQEALLLWFVEQNGFGNYVCYSDNGFNGLTPNRPGFSLMMNDIDSSQIDCVIVREMSRVYRDYAEMAKWFNAVEDKGIRVISVNDAYDSSQILGSGWFREMLELLQTVS